MKNPQLPAPTEIPYDVLAALLASFGWRYGVLIYRRDSDGDSSGGEGITSAGITYRDSEIAKEIGNMMKKIMGWKPEETESIDKMVAEAQREIATGPKNDPDLGNRLLSLPTEKKT